MYDVLQEVWDALTAAGADFEIHRVEVRGQKLRAFKNAPGSLRDVWLASGAHAEKDATVCGGQIAKHKLPRYVWFLDESIPRNVSGKFLKRALRETLDPADAS